MNNDDDSKHSTLTVESALWILVVAAALALRLFKLGAAPLSAAEAREATWALRAASGRGFPTEGYNPVLLAASGLLFTLFGTSDFLARLLPAVVGAALVLSPWLFRRQLGRVGALAAGIYLAISPSALALSRQLSGTGIAACGAMASFGGVHSFLETKRRGWLTLAAVGLALALSSGATGYATLLPLGVAWLTFTQPRPWDRPSVVKDRVSLLAPHAPRLFLEFVVALLVIGTGFGWNLSGVGAVGGMLADLLDRFRPTLNPAASPLLLLVVYEPVGVVFGIGGLVWGLRGGHPTAARLGLWAGLELVLLALLRGRMPTDVLWAVLPLAMLAGIAVDALVRHWSTRDLALRVAYAGLVLVLWAYAYLMLSRYSAYGDQADLALALVAVVVQALLALSFGFALGPAGALWMSTAATAVVLLALTVSAGWGVAFGHPADPREVLLEEPTAMGARDLAETLRDYSWERTGMPMTLRFVFEASEDSVLSWYLRDFEMAVRVDRISGVTDGADEILITASQRGEEELSGGEGQYAGQDFAIRQQWSPRALGCRFKDGGCEEAIGWYLFRDGPALPEAVEWATLWRRVDAVGTE